MSEEQRQPLSRGMAEKSVQVLGLKHGPKTLATSPTSLITITFIIFYKKYLFKWE